MVAESISSIETTTELNTIAQVAEALSRNPIKSYDVVHQFTHGMDGKVNLYTRGCLLLPGHIYISKKHRTEHPWFMLKGACWVYSDETKEWIYFTGANAGVTKSGMQRILWIEEPTVWATCHVTDTDDLNKIEHEIIECTEIPNMIEGRPVRNFRSLLR